MNAVPAEEQAAGLDHGFRLETLTIDPVIGEIVGPGCRERVDPKVMAVLRLLAERPDELVTRDQLLQRIWPNVAVTDDALARCIYQLRRHLIRASGDAAYKALIQTLPKRGYRLTAPVEPVRLSAAGDEHEAAERSVVTGSSHRRHAIPAIAGLAAAAVIGLQLGAAPEPVISSTVPPSAEGSLTVEAHYQQARFLYHRRDPGDVERAERHYSKAVELDPSHARAWAGLAAVHNLRRADNTAGDRLERMREAVEHALAADPEDGEVQFRAAKYYSLIGARERAAEHWRRALESGANDPLVLSGAAGDAFAADRLDEAFELQRRALKLSPLSAVYRKNLAHMLLAVGRIDEAAAELHELRGISPSSVTPYDRALLAVAEGRDEDALSLTDDWPPAYPLKRAHIVALAAFETGQEIQADRALQTLQSGATWPSKLYAADVLARRGRFDEAFAQLDAAHAAALDVHSLEACDLRSEATASVFVRTLSADTRWFAWLDRVDESIQQHSRVAQGGVEPVTRASR